MQVHGVCQEIGAFRKEFWLSLRKKRDRSEALSEPREWDRGVNAAPPPEPPLPTRGPQPASPTPGSQLPRFSRRREEREGERQGCAWLLLPPLPSAGPFPSRQETSPDSQPAAALPPPPHPHQLQAHGVTLDSAGAQRLRPGSSGAAPTHRPLLLVPGPRPSLLPHWPHAAWLAPDLTEALSPRPASL